MDGIRLEAVMIITISILSIQSLCFLVYLTVNKILNKSRFLRFIGILLIGMVTSLVPMGPLSVALGFPAVFMTAILVSCLLDKEK